MVRHALVVALHVAALLLTVIIGLVPHPSHALLRGLTGYVYSLPGDLIRRLGTVATSFAGHRVIRIANPTKSLLKTVGTRGLDVWARSRYSIDIRVGPGTRDIDQLRVANGGQLNFRILVPSVSALLAKDAVARTPPPRRPGMMAAPDPPVPTYMSFFNDYRTYPQIVEYLQAKCAEFPNVCEFVPSIGGQSVEGRDIAMVKVGTSLASANSTRPQVLVQALMHGREWASGTTALYLFHQLLEQSRSSPLIQQLLGQVDIHFIPVLNPDGYMYSHTTNRLWRKNRRRHALFSTFGVDLNRNFPHRWANPNGGSSLDPNDETYRGPRPASEPEVKALVDYVAKEMPRMIAALDLHAFSEMIMRPWGDTPDPTPHEEQYKQITERMALAVNRVHGQDFLAIKSIDLYPTSGTANDYYYAQTKIDGSTGTANIRPYSVAIELRPNPETDNGAFGFMLPASQIIPTGEEIFGAFLLYVRNAIANPLRV